MENIENQPLRASNFENLWEEKEKFDSEESSLLGRY